MTKKRPATTKRGRQAPRFAAPQLTKPRLIGLVAAVVLLLIGVYALAAVTAVSTYQHRLASGSFIFTGSLIFTGQDFLSPMNTNMNFSGTYTQSDGQPAISTEFLGSWATREYSGSARVLAGKLYFALSSPDMPTVRYRQGSYLYQLEAGRWYTASLDNSIYNNVCANTQPPTVASKLELYRTIKQLKITPSPWVNLWASVGNERATHVSGSISGSQLASLWDAAQKATPAGCTDNTIGLSSDDLKHFTTHLDLYSGQDGTDQLKITLTDKTLGATATLTLTTSHYGQAPGIPAPTDATDLASLFAQLGLH
ncbi:MAG TPA: hypothetical protein VGH44_02485 [Candidatus Saccharimonadia bacterium]|jgi:hypothetical protein